MGKATPIIGIDDGRFDLFDNPSQLVTIIGVVMKGAELIEGIMQTHVTIDPVDPTTAIIEMISNSKHKKHIQAVFHEGITIAGFGVIDLEQLYEELQIPVIIISRKLPDLERIESVLKHNFNDYKQRWILIDKLDPPAYVAGLNLYLQYIGISEKHAIEMIRRCTKVGLIPEAVRVAHMIGTSYTEFNK